MKEPVRWIDPDSEAQPELRSLVRYAGERAPNAAQLSALTESVLARLPGAELELEPTRSTAPTSAPVGAPRAAQGTPPMFASTLAALVVSASLVTAWMLLRPRVLPAPATVVEQAPAAREAVQLVDASVDTGVSPTPAELPPAVAPRRRPVSRDRAPVEAREQNRGTPAASVSRKTDMLGEASELALLHAARVARRSSPRDALQLLSEHERSYPQTTLHEEREALMIEVLQQLDPSQAAKRLANFELRYPASGYRRGLRKQE